MILIFFLIFIASHRFLFLLGFCFAKCRVVGINMGYFPAENPEMAHFRRSAIGAVPVVGASIARPGILFTKCRAAGTKLGYFPSENPEMFHFRRSAAGAETVGEGF